MERKKTAWKKSRKFGDVYGGRRLPKLTDGLLKRVHSLETPSPTDNLPLLRRDNPSRDFFFPLNAELLLFHEVGHHIDWCSKHRRSSPNLKLSEEFADQYAFERTSLRGTTYRGASQAGNNPAL